MGWFGAESKICPLLPQWSWTDTSIPGWDSPAEANVQLGVILRGD